MSMMVRGISNDNLPWALIFMGAALRLGARLIGLSVLAFGVGIYLPIHLNLAIFVGGTIRALVQKKFPKTSERHKGVMEKGMLMSSGMVAGGAMVGLIVAMLTYFKLDKSTNVGGPFEESMIAGLVVFLLLAVYLYTRVVKKGEIH